MIFSVYGFLDQTVNMWPRGERSQMSQRSRVTWHVAVNPRYSRDLWTLEDDPWPMEDDPWPLEDRELCVTSVWHLNMHCCVGWYPAVPLNQRSKFNVQIEGLLTDAQCDVINVTSMTVSTTAMTSLTTILTLQMTAMECNDDRWCWWWQWRQITKQTPQSLVTCFVYNWKTD